MQTSPVSGGKIRNFFKRVRCELVVGQAEPHISTKRGILLTFSRAEMSDATRIKARVQGASIISTDG